MFDTIVAKLKEDGRGCVGIDIRKEIYTFHFYDGNEVKINFIGGMSFWKTHYIVVVNGVEVIHEGSYFRKKRLYKLVQQLLKETIHKTLFKEKVSKNH